jgi:hypothetical protein
MVARTVTRLPTKSNGKSYIYIYTYTRNARAASKSSERERERGASGEFECTYTFASTNACFSERSSTGRRERHHINGIAKRIPHSTKSTCTFHVVSVICSRLVSSGKVTARILDPSLMYSEKDDFE